MKTYKKITLGFCLAILASLAPVLFPERASAATADNDYWSACVVNIITPNNTSSKCKLDSNSGFAKLNYGGLEATDIQAAQFKASTSTGTLTSGGGAVTYPKTITLLNQNGQSLFSGNLSNEALTCGFLAYDTTANTKAQFSDTSTIYEIYKPSGVSASCNNFRFLTTFSADGTMRMLAMLNEQIQNGNPDYVYATKISKQISGVAAAAGVGLTDSSGAAAETDNSCEANYTGAAHEFNWIFCGILRGIDSMFNTMSGMVEDQLRICTGKSSTTSQTCGNSLLSDNVKKSWAVFRDLATALLVVIMLVMVISQALSAGPFDAYTVRKLLPKLAAAAILMQISWPLFKFFVDISNDLGQGVQDLMLAPFGGAGNFALDNLIGGAGNFAPGLTITAAAAFTGAAIAFSGITIFGIFMLGISAIASLFVGLLVLLFRQLLIILAMILAPVALLAWVLPGTQRYWKLWQDNFTKLLLMFPMIMAMIAAGKIFAKVGVDTGTGILGLIIVLVGVVGPYWFLPKTFKWGGQIFAAAASGALNATKGARNFPGKYALDRAKENRQFRAEERATRIGRDPVAASRWDQLLAGRYNVARSEGGRRRQYAHTVGEGQKAAREAVGQELTVSGYQNWGHDQKLDALEKWLRGESYAGINAEGNDELRLFAFKTLADLGDQDRIRKARQQGRLRGSVWLKGRAENISSLNQQASDMGIQADLSTVAPDAMANWKSHTWKEWIRQVDNGVMMDNSDDGGGDVDIQDPNGTGRRDPAKRQEQLAHAQSQANRILGNQLVFDRLSSDQQDFVRRMATMEGTQVAVSRTGGVEVPTGETLANRASVRENVMTHLSQIDRGGDGIVVADTIAPRVVQAARAVAAGTPLTPGQQGDVQLFQQLMDRGTAPDATPEMEKALANMTRAVNASLAQHEAETERNLTAAGSPNVSTALAAERARSDDVKRALGI